MLRPKDIVDFIFENSYEAKFLSMLQLHKNNYSIAEISDGRFIKLPNNIRFSSEMYKINVEIKDEDIITAVMNELYISAFIMRKDEAYNVSFLVHQYPKAFKPRVEDEIMMEVLRYMITNAVIAMRLDSFEKVKEYIGA